MDKPKSRSRYATDRNDIYKLVLAGLCIFLLEPLAYITHPICTDKEANFANVGVFVVD
jgi:hypothetical protein